MKTIIILLFLVSLNSFADENSFTVDECNKDKIQALGTAKFNSLGATPPANFADDLYGKCQALIKLKPEEIVCPKPNNTCVTSRSTVTNITVALKSMVPSSGCSNPNMSPGNIPLMEVTYPYKPLIGASVNVGGSDKHPKTVTITTFHMACGPSSDKVDYKGSKTGVGYTFTLTGI